MTAQRRPAFASQDWMLEQQLRAELEAEAWRRLRELSDFRELPPDVDISTVTHAEPDYHSTGSIIFKALVRFMIAACVAYLAWLAAVDAEFAEFEILLTVCAAYIVTLSVTLLGPARGLVHVLAETLKWMLIITVALGVLWWLVQGLA